MRAFFFGLYAGAFACAGGVAACAAGSPTGSFTTNADGPGGSASITSVASTSSVTSTSTATGPTGAGGFTSFSSGGGSAPMGSTGAGSSTSATSFYAYAHDASTLYRIDPTAPDLAPTIIGDFDCASMTDVAVNGAGDLWAVSSGQVHHLVVQGSTVHCDTSSSLKNAGDPSNVTFVALTFAPAGTLDPNKEVLIAGNTAGELWEIETAMGPTFGQLTQRGTLGNVPSTDPQGRAFEHPGGRWEISGDIVFLAHEGSPVGFATARDCPKPPSNSKCNPTDTLLEIDLSKLASASTKSVTLGVRGQVVRSSVCPDPAGTTYGSMYGVAAWNDKVYGFSFSGGIVEIDNDTGAACSVPSTATATSVKWAGAGVTTLAPVTVPPPPR